MEGIGFEEVLVNDGDAARSHGVLGAFVEVVIQGLVFLRRHGGFEGVFGVGARVDHDRREDGKAAAGIRAAAVEDADLGGRGLV